MLTEKLMLPRSPLVEKLTRRSSLSKKQIEAGRELIEVAANLFRPVENADESEIQVVVARNTKTNRTFRLTRIPNDEDNGRMKIDLLFENERGKLEPVKGVSILLPMKFKENSLPKNVWLKNISSRRIRNFSIELGESDVISSDLITDPNYNLGRNLKSFN
ncbi:MAG: hypothetical protein ABH812_02810 [bacterium]